jgi:hypothetical protein
VRRYIAHEVVVDADTAAIPVGVDGEALVLPTPVHCRIRPGALRVRVPQHRLGVPVPGSFDPARLARAALNRPTVSVSR